MLKPTVGALFIAFAVFNLAGSGFAHAQSSGTCTHTNGTCDPSACPTPSEGNCYVYTHCDPASCLCSNPEPVTGCTPTDMATNVPPPPPDTGGGGCSMTTTAAPVSAAWAAFAVLATAIGLRRRKRSA